MGIKFGAPILLLERVFHSQDLYFMQVYGRKWIADRGFRFHAPEVIRAVLLLGLAILIWYLLARTVRWVMDRRWGLWCLGIASLTAAAALAMRLPLARTLYSHRNLNEFIVFPTGMFWLACGVLVWSMVAFLRRRQTVSLGVAVLSAYAITTGIRVMSQIETRNYAIFYNSALFLIFVFVLIRVIDRAATGLPTTAKIRLRFSLACLQTAWLGLLQMPYPKALPAKLATDKGVIYTRPAEASIFPRVISFINQRKADGQSVMVMPEATSLYFFTGTDTPVRWYQLVPGSLAPDEEGEFIAEIERRKVDFILLTNRRTSEYGFDYFGLDYNQRVYRWIEAHYELAGQFGEFARESGRHFAILIYRRRP
jgi:hypothetical protein